QRAHAEQLNATFLRADQAELGRFEREASCSETCVTDRAPQIESDAAALRRCEHTRAVRRAHDGLIEHELRPVEPHPRAQPFELHPDTAALVDPVLQLDAILGPAADDDTESGAREPEQQARSP